jgi:phage repressor protein C with HTH and peptisase S24 domain
LAAKIEGMPSNDIFKPTSIPPGARAIVSADETDSEVGHIPYWSVRGSCGGGIMNYESLPKGHLTKEASFFKKYDLRPQDSFAIYADGNSMADFIVDGDLVIFNKAKTVPISGEIFAIEHPDGLRIKRLRRKINGTWVLESRNVDKQKYPDEEISQNDGELLQIIGQFVYRQGG